jgi:hypothetical protein
MYAGCAVARHPGNGTPALASDSVPVPLAAGEEGVGIDWSLLPLLLPMERDSLSVTLGCDLGALSSALAAPGSTIVALDPHFERVKLLEWGQVQTERANVFPVCGGSTGCLPLRDGSVGLTVVNLRRDRAGLGMDGDPLRIDLSLVTEVRRVLKVGGILCVAVSQRGCHMSPSESRALLRRCGFSTVESYMPLSRRDWFTTLVPIVSGKAMRSCIDVLVEGNAFRERSQRAWLKILATSGLLQYLAPEYMVIGRKEA